MAVATSRSRYNLRPASELMAELKVVYRRDREGRWIASVSGLRRCRGRGRSIGDARRRLRESLAGFVEDPYGAHFLEDVKLPPPARRLLVRHWRARRRAEKARGEAQEAARQTLETLRGLKIKPRDAAELMGLSPLKVQQLLRGR